MYVYAKQVMCKAVVPPLLINAESVSEQLQPPWATPCFYSFWYVYILYVLV